MAINPDLHHRRSARDPLSDMQAFEDEDGQSDITDSDISEVGDAEIPQYFAERDGRLFHSHGSAPYPLPVDGTEQNVLSADISVKQRIDAQHVVLRHVMGGIVVDYDAVEEVLNSPFPGQRRVVDLATGTGRWVLDFADEYRGVIVHGLDIVPLATRFPPPHVYFEIQDINERLRFRDGSIDLVHARSVSMATRNYRDLVDEVGRVLRPGGLFLAGEWGRCAAMTGGLRADVNLPRTSLFYQAIHDTLRQVHGIAPVASSLARQISNSGHFEDIRSRVYSVPVGNWHAEPDLRACGEYFRNALNLYAKSMADMMKEAGRDQSEVAELERGYVQEMYSVPGIVCLFHTVQARRR